MKEEDITGEDGKGVLLNSAAPIGALIATEKSILLHASESRPKQDDQQYLLSSGLAKIFFRETDLLFNTQLFIINAYNLKIYN